MQIIGQAFIKHLARPLFHFALRFGVFLGLLASASAYAVNDMQGGPAVNQLNFQTPVTAIARDIYALHTMMLIICSVIFIGVFGVMLYSIVVHRKSKGHTAANFHESTTVEIIWTAIPFLIILLMALPATRTIIAMKNTHDADITVKVTGYQWKWGYDYIEGPGKGIHFISTLSSPRDPRLASDPTGRTLSDTHLQEVDHPLVVPVNQKIRIITTAADVIHSWYVPAFAVKQDAFPGLTRDTWFKAEKIGTYRGFCAELCGKDHAYMPVVVKVVSEQDYAAWVKAQSQKSSRAPSSPSPKQLTVDTQSAPSLKTTEVANNASLPGSTDSATQPVDTQYTLEQIKQRGQRVYAAQCAVCHRANGEGFGPFPAIDGSPVSMGPIQNHIDIVLKGRGQMPPWGHRLSDEDVAAVITYQRNAWKHRTNDMVDSKQVAARRRAPKTPS
jgi:cytochrome c oxidase subunit 2